MAIVTKNVEVADRRLSIETGRVAEQANGAVILRQGDTVVLSTAVMAKEPRVGIDWFPLTCDYEEKLYAAGKIPGAFMRREGRPSETAILASRLTDRPLRPLFPDGFRLDVQVVSTVLSVDQENDPTILSINGASTALVISNIPFAGPVGAVRMGFLDGKVVVNPSMSRMAESQLDLVVAGTADAILMVEAGAKGVSEQTVLEALEMAHNEIKRICAVQAELQQQVGRPKYEFAPATYSEQAVEIVSEYLALRLDKTIYNPDKAAREAATDDLRKKTIAELGDRFPDHSDIIGKLFDKALKDRVRQRIVEEGVRQDGRGLKDVRQITVEVGVLPRTHGSGLFTRGQTQALTIATLGSMSDAQKIDGLTDETSKRYMHHYNFPPFSVGEAGRLAGPKRRDIGHGALAERALVPVVPSIEDFPYSVRVVSDIFESNGSSSMASVCGSSLSLMDAGVPITRPVAGIAMGLIKEGDDYVVLTDIAGVEDHLGDMDFKVAGTERGITALQMDIKITGVTFEILRDALTQAHEARKFILAKMAEIIAAPREALSVYAPRIEKVKIDPSQIGMLIGKGGETIRGLCEEFESQIDVNDDGQVLIYSANGELADALVERIRTMMKEVEIGDEYLGKVVKTTTFGAFIELSKGTDGLLHISNVSPGQRVDTVEDVLNKGDEVSVRVVEVDRERGRIGLRLAEDPEVAGKSVEELASVGTGGGGGGRPPRDRDGGGRNGGEGRAPRGGDRGSGRPRHGGRD